MKENHNSTIGYMEMPANFKYKEVYLRGRPRHEKYDDFWRKHPPMSASRWSKIYNPFAALEGFDECINSKKVLYETRRELSEYDLDNLNEQLQILHSLTFNGKAARENRPAVVIEYFHPCTDRNSEWYGTGGTYKTISGTVLRINTIGFPLIHLYAEGEETAIPLRDIVKIQLNGSHAESSEETRSA